MLINIVKQPSPTDHCGNKNNTNNKTERIIFHCNFLQAKKKLRFHLKIVNSIEQCKILRRNSRFGKKLQLLVLMSKVKTYNYFYGCEIKVYLTKKNQHLEWANFFRKLRTTKTIL